MSQVEVMILDGVRRVLKYNSVAYPRTVATAGVPYTSRRIRTFMAAMAADGKLIRLGQRGGYILPSADASVISVKAG